MPLGVDIVEPPMLAALEAEGITVRDAQQVMLDAREVKSIDEIMLLNTACAMVDGAYQLIAEQLKPGIRESQLVANVTKLLFDMGSEHVDNINAVSGERCSPHPHVFSDRLIRPGDQAFFDIIQTFVGYKTCYYRTFVVGTRERRPARCLQAGTRVDRRVDRADAAGRDHRPGRERLAEGRGVRVRQRDGGFGLQFGHSVGLFLHERPIISRLNSLDHPVELKEGMVIALETYCPAKDGVSAARIEEEVVVTANGPQVITRFPSAGAVRRQRVLKTKTDAARPLPWIATDRPPAVPDHGRVPEVRGPRTGALLRGARAGDDAPRHRPGGGRGRVRGGDAEGRLHVLHVPRPQPHAGPRRRRWRRSMPSCSGAARACWAARAARCTSRRSSTG